MPRTLRTTAACLLAIAAAAAIAAGAGAIPSSSTPVETEVYLRAPGTVVRCRTCRSTLMVLVTVRGTTCVDLRGLASLERA